MKDEQYKEIERVWNECKPAKTRKPKSKWINVKDKLPEMVESDIMFKLESTPVLVFTKYKYFKIATLEQWIDDIEDKDKAEWCSFDSERWTITEEVTHWQPLPEAPEV